ncbi:hypothetical protein RM550_35105 [Streptomyces sp. DSM 41527]|uniref:Uncharacterized protein n=1 Tax=Streptomyces mooreae TaxID=3075523 RepID=A0ABU2TJ30_9ACTN|nr:hypothetical protein [Streptomyces sp. DSM 41527]
MHSREFLLVRQYPGAQPGGDDQRIAMHHAPRCGGHRTLCRVAHDSRLSADELRLQRGEMLLRAQLVRDGSQVPVSTCFDNGGRS